MHMVHLIWVAWAIEKVRNTKYQVHILPVAGRYEIKKIPFVKTNGIFLTNGFRSGRY